jgi:DNA-binding SARP family transcriptional activator/predicted negative regulator of RcsB-dependent stress response
MELTLFGGFQLFDDSGDPIDLSARKSKALLAWLAMHQDKRQARDRLAVLLWEESDNTQARHSLRQALSGLRKTLGHHAEALVADQESVVLIGGHIQVDANRFEALMQKADNIDVLSEGISLYGGEFLEGFNPRSNSYEEWLMTQRSHFREQAVNGMAELLQHYLETQQLESGIRLAIRLLSSDPLQERTHRSLMQLYVRMNRPADALRQYRQCRKVLQRELGLAPEPETTSLYREIAQARTQSVGETETTTVVSPPSVEPDAQLASVATFKSASATIQQLRPVTVVHLHMSGFLVLVSELDPEQLQHKTAYIREHLGLLVKQLNGQVHLQRDDAMTILFGLPMAYGNECEKAVRLANLVNQQGDDELSAAIRSLGVVAGISNGTVLCDGERVISGAVFAQAEQLARAGEPGQILLSDMAYRTLRHPLSARQRNDGSWQLDMATADQPSVDRTTPFIGRKRELRQFAAALNGCIDEQLGETFLIRGEAGIGKTRLVEEIEHQIRQQGGVCHKTLVLDFGMESQEEPIPALLRQVMDLSEGATAQQIEAMAKQCMGEAWNVVLHPHALCALFRLPLSDKDTGQQASFTDEALRLGSIQLLNSLLESATQTQLRLLVVEDIHWADKQTLAMVAEIATIVSRCSALLVVTSRVEGEPLDPAWRSAMHGAPLTTIDLGPLAQEQVRLLARELGGDDDEVVNRCIERSGGNPFFLEQLLWSSARRSESVPDSVQSLVLNRLDILADIDRGAACAASVMGQRFRLEPLQHLMQNEAYQLDNLLKQRMIRPEGEGFLFGHALLREGIYASILPSQKRALHQRAAEWYRDRDKALYARHLDLADNPLAAKAYLRAADYAVNGLDFEQALRLATRGIEIAKSTDLAVQLNLMCGELLFQAGHIERAKLAFQTVIECGADQVDHCRGMIGLASCITVQDQLNEALALLEEVQPLAQQCGDQSLQTELHYRRGDILFALARVDECLDAHRQAEALAQASQMPLLEIRALAGMADAYYANGRMKTACLYFERCIELARKQKRLPQELGNLSMLGLARFYNGSVQQALAETVEAAKLSAEYGNLRAEMFGYINMALIQLYSDDVEAAEVAGWRGLKLAEQLGASRFYGDCLVAIGEAQVLQGKLDEGIETIERAYRSSMESVPTHYAAFILGVLARVTPDAQRRQEAITEGKRILDSGSLSHNHLHYYQNMIDVCLMQQDAAGARQNVAALAEYTQAEPLAWSDFYIARGTLLANVLQNGVIDEQRVEAKRLLDIAQQAGLFCGTEALHALLDL